ncbi:MAG: molecular chaperone DnaJ [Actinomycetota bacterium]
MAGGDLYGVLGLTRDATQEDIKRAYRRLAREHHPDVNHQDPEAERRFKEINLAYQTLSDPAKRRQYDLFGGEGLTPDMFAFGDLSDIFEAFFGSSPFTRTRRRESRTSRGRDLHVVLELDFEDAAFGTSTEVRADSLETCTRCTGTGAEPGTHPSRCTTCGGSGEVSDVRRSVFGTVMTSRTCATCQGTGEEVGSPCRQCRGAGRTPATQAVPVEVPAGVSDGMDLRIEGAGEDGSHGGYPGDLYLTVAVRPHPVFDRQGQDLVCVLEVPFTAAALGAEVEVETLDGPATVKVPAGTRAGSVIRLRGKGVPHLGRRGRGDLLIQVDLDVPGKVSKKERRLLEGLAELRGEGAGPLRGRLAPRG